MAVRDHEHLVTVCGEQGFVGGDDMFSICQGRQDEGARRFIAAHKFDDDIGIRIIDNLCRVGSHQLRRDGNHPGRGNIQIGDSF